MPQLQNTYNSLETKTVPWGETQSRSMLPLQLELLLQDLGDQLAETRLPEGQRRKTRDLGDLPIYRSNGEVLVSGCLRTCSAPSS